MSSNVGSWDTLLTELADTREKLRISDALLREQIRLYQDIGERLTAETEKRRELEEALQASRKLNVELHRELCPTNE